MMWFILMWFIFLYIYDRINSFDERTHCNLGVYFIHIHCMESMSVLGNKNENSHRLGHQSFG